MDTRACAGGGSSSVDDPWDSHYPQPLSKSTFFRALTAWMGLLELDDEGVNRVLFGAGDIEADEGGGGGLGGDGAFFCLSHCYIDVRVYVCVYIDVRVYVLHY